MSRRKVTLLTQHRMRNRVVVQAGDMPQADRKIRYRLTIGSKECAALSRMLVRVDVDMESRLNSRDTALHLHLHTIASTTYNLQAILLRELDHSVVILLCGTKPRSELRHGKEVPV